MQPSDGENHRRYFGQQWLNFVIESVRPDTA